MKGKKIVKTLVLKKLTIANFNNSEMGKVQGGVVSTHCDTEEALCLSAEPSTICAYCLTYAKTC